MLTNAAMVGGHRGKHLVNSREGGKGFCYFSLNIFERMVRAWDMLTEKRHSGTTDEPQDQPQG